MRAHCSSSRAEQNWMQTCFNMSALFFAKAFTPVKSLARGKPLVDNNFCMQT
jgi:hypothetical protein